MRFQKKNNPSITCNADFISVGCMSAIIFDDGPMRVVSLETFEADWEEVPGNPGDSVVVYIDKLLAVARAANKLLSPPYRRFGFSLNFGQDRDKDEANWGALESALRAAGIEGERLC